MLWRDNRFDGLNNMMDHSIVDLWFGFGSLLEHIRQLLQGLAEASYARPKRSDTDNLGLRDSFA